LKAKSKPSLRRMTHGAQLLEQLPTHEANLREKARFLHLELGSPGVWQRAAATLRSVEQEITDPQDNGRPLQVKVAQNSEPPLFLLFEYTRKSVPSLLTAALALLLTVFVLLQYRDLRDRAVRLMGTSEIGRSAQAFDDAGSDLSRYLLLQAAVNIGFGVFVGLALWVIGIPSPALWGALTAILRFVPYIGAFVSAAPMALAAMIDPGWGKLLQTIRRVAYPLASDKGRALFGCSDVQFLTLDGRTCQKPVVHCASPRYASTSFTGEMSDEQTHINNFRNHLCDHRVCFVRPIGSPICSVHVGQRWDVAFPVFRRVAGDGGSGNHSRTHEVASGHQRNR
jgi:hypothetical protein